MPRQTEARSHRANPVIRSAAQLSPYRQGQFDGLCGIYCTLNALQLAAYPLKPLSVHKSHVLFNTAIAWLRRNHPQRNPVNYGMSIEMMLELAYNIVKWASGPRLKFSVEYGDAFAAEEWVGRSLHQGLPVIACLCEEAHFSVVINITPTGLILFDSQGRVSLPKANGEPWIRLLDLESLCCIRASAR
jgi:hypothetical protein